MIGDTLINFFSAFGIAGMLLSLYLIFLIDSMIFPALPDFFILIIYSANPDFGWGIILLFIAVFASFSGNTLLYLLVKKISVPKWVKKLMRKYSKILIMSDERILLLNRIAPVLPYTGAFIAINNWDYKKLFPTSWWEDSQNLAVCSYYLEHSTHFLKKAWRKMRRWR